jgi:hypothetical protein
VHLAGLTPHFVKSAFSRRTVPASRHLPATRLWVEQRHGHATAATVLADPVQPVHFVTQVRTEKSGIEVNLFF